MDVYKALAYILLGTCLGVIGQGARVIVGLKKVNDETSISEKEVKDVLDFKRLFVSLLIGGVAGSLGGIALLDTEINREFLITLIATGYSGADFIEGFMRTKTPK